MKDNYPIVQPWVLAYEGGYANHPKDPGGATMEGVTQRTYDAFRRRVGLTTQPVQRMAPGERDRIYKEQYWDAVRGDDLPSGIDAAVYDYAVNSGPGRAARDLQAVLGVAQDGVIGIMTLDAARSANAADVIRALCERRFAFMKRLRHWPTFKTGWTRRVMGEQMGVQDSDTGIIDRATRLSRQVPSIPAPKVRDDGAGAVAPEGEVNIWAALFAALAAFFGKGK